VNIPMLFRQTLTVALLALGSAVAVSHALAIESLPEDHPKFQAISYIYASVARAFGTGRNPPSLVVVPVNSKNRKHIAWTDSGTEGSVGVEDAAGQLQQGYIAIEEKVYDILASLGAERDDGMAFLLGHELAHYYLRHGWVSDFGNLSFVSRDMGKKMQRVATYEETIKMETEADYFGGFYGYLAGYNTLGVAPRLFELLYAAYRLPEKIPNYPSRADRVAIAERSEENLRKMVPVYETGKRLLILEHYEEAARLFEHLSHTFPSREMFNNAGIAYALEALRLYPPGKLLFAYPFEYDAETRLRTKETRTRSVIDTSESRRTHLLQKAADSFESALQRDREYVTAVANLAAVTSLIGDPDIAISYASRAVTLARRQNESQILAAALVSRGIALAESGDRDRAIMDFAAARNYGLESGSYNFAVMQGEKTHLRSAGNELEGPHRETIGGHTAIDSFAKSKDAVSFTLRGIEAGQTTISINIRRGEGWEEIKVAMGTRILKMIATGRGYEGTTARAIKVGSSASEVKGKYGTPTRLVPSRQGNSLVYQKAGVVFGVDRDERVVGWMVYTLL